MEQTKTPVQFLFSEMLQILKPTLTIENELMITDCLKRAIEYEEQMNEMTWIDSKLLTSNTQSDYSELIDSFQKYYKKHYKE